MRCQGLQQRYGRAKGRRGLPLIDTLQVSDLRPGLKIQLTAHPEWGDWIVLRKYADRIWEIRGRRGETTLFEGEAHFWHKVST